MCRWIGSRAASPSTRIRPRSGESGFTLLEVLVAFAVLAVMIVPILQVFGGGLGTAESARAHTTAALLARSKLAEVGVLQILEGETTGTFEVPGYRWRQSIVLHVSEAIPLEPYGIDEQIEAGARQSGLRQGRSGFGERQGGLGQDRATEQRRSSSSSSRPRSRSQAGASSTAGGLAARGADPGGLSGDELIAYEVTVTVEWAGFRGGGAVTLSTLRLGRQPNNLRTGVR